jgi:hypothetical protein
VRTVRTNDAGNVAHQARTRAVGIRKVDTFCWLILACTATVSLLLRVVGVSFDASQLTSQANVQQLADVPLLRDHVLVTIWNLHIQPPLFNATIGLLARLPGAWQAHVAAILYFACYSAICLATYGSMVLLGVPRRVALAVTVVFVVLDPAQFLFSTTLLYATPTAALVTCLGFLGIWLTCHPTVLRVLLFSSVGAVLALTNTSMQPVVFIGILALICLVLPWRTVVKGASLPVAVLLFWVGHMMVSFGTPATSTWLGMNLARSTTSAAPSPLIHGLIAQHDLTPLAAKPPFQVLSDYRVRPSTTGPAVLSQIVKDNGKPNFNNRAYIRISREFLSNDLKFIELEPKQYAGQVLRGTSVWFVPADQFYAFQPLRLHDYRQLYDVFVQWQPSRDQSASVLAAYFHLPANWSQLSYLQILANLLSVCGTPILIAFAWRDRRSFAAGLAIMGLLFLQSFILLNLSDIGENNRFRFEAGTLPITLATVVLTCAAKVLSRRHRYGSLALHQASSA